MNGSNRTVALVVAAGSGNRAGDGPPKQYRRIGARTVLEHALDGLIHPAVDAVQVVIAPGHQELYADAAGARALPPPVLGGATRMLSVRSGLDAVAALGAERVLIHDAARPFLPPAVIDRLLAALDGADGAVPVLPVVDSLACAGTMLGQAVDRTGLARVQTPQAFGFGAIRAAHRCWRGGVANDDAEVARAAGLAVACVQGDAMLEKITHADDIRRAEARFGAGLVSRTGLGFDVHAFCAGDGLWLGGLWIPHERGLSGHSDADVVLHALTDALLGTIGAGDIGDHFPPSDPQWRGAASSLFLDHARQLIERRGGRIDHVDVTVICEAPRIGPLRERMKSRIADLLRLPVGNVGVKATTTEGLGFTGRGEGIAAQATATVRVPEER